MFGPNTHIKDSLKVSYSHRDNKFFTLYKEVDTLFKSTFNLEEYTLLYIPGSGTVGIEAVIRSVTPIVNLIGNEGKFKSRWQELTNQYISYGPESVDMFCQLETSNSTTFNREGCIVDAISSFPFYDLPNNTKIFITCANKILGSFPGLSIIGIHRDYTDLIEYIEDFSYLNLGMYLQYAKKQQLPTTAPTHLFQHLKKVLSNFDLEEIRNKIVQNSCRIVNEVGSENVIGENICPVITVSKKCIPDFIATKYQLYGINSTSEYYQIFTYSAEQKDYDNFINDLKVC
tara:strand:+ start:6016 stop:6876 length:861 start_codon:yes stop_codon:yes gene_type:complete